MKKSILLACVLILTPIANIIAGCPYPTVGEGWEWTRNVFCSQPYAYSTGTYSFQTSDQIQWPDRTETLHAFEEIVPCQLDPAVTRPWSTGTEGNLIFTIYTNNVGYVNPDGTKTWQATATSDGCYRSKTSPILINFGANLSLTSSDAGVRFDLENSGHKLKIGWTSANSEIAWLIVGQNVTSSAQLFGNLSPQATPLYSSETENGYRALRIFDSNSDSEISPADSIWPELNLWFDENHNGISESNEIVPLGSKVQSINLSYKTIGKKDANGNVLRFRSNVTLLNGDKTFSFDIFPDISTEPEELNYRTYTN